MYHLTSQAFDEAYLQRVEKGIRTSPYYGDSPLGEEFVRTKGFSIVFTRSALEQVLSKFAYLAPFLEKALFASSNAFYINPLVMGATSRVDTHVDCRLLLEENVRIIPNLISILYTRCEDDIQGGNLLLKVDKETTITLTPKTGDLLHFQGDLLHSVEEVTGEGLRVNVVCEQYNLSEDLLKSFPKFAVLTNEDPAPRVS